MRTRDRALRRRLELPTSGCGCCESLSHEKRCSRGGFRIRSLFKKWPPASGCERGAIFWSEVRARTRTRSGGCSLRICAARLLDPVSTGCEPTAYATLIGGGAFHGRLALVLALAAFSHCRRNFAEFGAALLCTLVYCVLFFHCRRNFAEFGAALLCTLVYYVLCARGSGWLLLNGTMGVTTGRSDSCT